VYGDPAPVNEILGLLEGDTTASQVEI